MEQLSEATESSDSSTPPPSNSMDHNTRRTIYGLLRIKTAADTLPVMLHLIVSNGKMAIPIFLVGYIAFFLFWLPFWGLAFLVSEIGVYALCVGIVFFVGRAIIR